MRWQTAKNVAGVVAILGIYQFLQIKDPSFPSIFALVSYVIQFVTMLMIAFGGYYGIHQYIGLIQYTIKEDILGMTTTSIDRFREVDPKAAAKITDQDSDPEDPAYYTSIG